MRMGREGRGQISEAALCLWSGRQAGHGNLRHMRGGQLRLELAVGRAGEAGQSTPHKQSTDMSTDTRIGDQPSFMDAPYSRCCTTVGGARGSC